MHDNNTETVPQKITLHSTNLDVRRKQAAQ